MAVEPAGPQDAHPAALMAAAKRDEYARYSPVFWRVAEGALELHEPFLARCITDPTFTALAVRRDQRLLGIILANHRVLPPPFGADPEPSWLVDDFFIDPSVVWMTVGLQLLGAVEDAARNAGAQRLIVLTARLDVAKRSAIEAAGYVRGASWWVRTIDPDPAPLPDLRINAVVGPAPPVYDPGGLTALALDLDDAGDVPQFEEWAAASDAVLAIIPIRAANRSFEQAVADRGYEPASDWLVKDLAS